MTIKIEVNSQDALAVVYVSGVFDYTCYDDFNAVLSTEADNAAKVSRYVLDFKGTSYMDSSALGMLVMLRDQAMQHQADVIIRGCNENILQILKIANFQKIFKIIDLEAR